MTDIARSGAFIENATRTYKPVSSWFFPHPVAWIICAILMVAEAIWIPLAGFSISFGTSWIEFAGVFALLIAAAMLSHYNWHRLAIFAFTIAFFFFFGKQGNVLNYLTHALGFPWADARLAQIESAMGFDWLAHLAWINNHPIIAEALQRAYDMLHFFTILTGATLLLFGKMERLREFSMLFAISLIITIILGAVFPAGGAYHFYQPAAELHTNIAPHSGRFFLVHLLPVHDGTMKFIEMDHTTGLITFPSYHMVMALLMMWVTRRTLVFPVFVVFNILMASAIPVFGGHYLSDIAGGVVVAVVSVWIYYRWSGRKIGMQHEDLPIKIS